MPDPTKKNVVRLRTQNQENGHFCTQKRNQMCFNEHLLEIKKAISLGLWVKRNTI